ncbi:hypothetical protein CISIN_1g045575mg [Citrus sinensis]|uniref:Uncharacterized protein n=1 Tax=Citrus sinensis TaxID=2711 RepID=A0A067D6N0_CITSI|nr:hypothetical protein CISIN_1g045575mg [Citrus sinensis]
MVAVPSIRFLHQHHQTLPSLPQVSIKTQHDDPCHNNVHYFIGAQFAIVKQIAVPLTKFTKFSYMVGHHFQHIHNKCIPLK